jgi:glycosyltransferase involved in cell wall biosynthesis
LLLIGAGDGLEESKALAGELGLDGIANFLGRLSVEEYSSILTVSDIGLSPYCGWPEYSGLKIFDYKAAGLACIASGEDGQPTTLAHGSTGWIVPPCNEDALAEAISALASDSKLRLELGRAARLEAESRHTWQYTAEGIEAILERCVSP